MAQESQLSQPVPWYQTDDPTPIAPYDPNVRQDQRLKGTSDEIIPTPIASARVKGGSVPQSSSIIGQIADATQLFTQRPAGTEGPRAAVPTSQQADLQLNPNEVLKLISQPVDDKTLAQFLTPTATGHAMQMPASMTAPVPSFQPTPFMPQGVGARAARQRGIANAITGVANAVGMVGQHIKQEQHEKIAISTQRLMEAQQAIDQASQFINNPNITPQQKASLQQSIDQNKTIMNSILSDDRLRKGIEKGLNISFTNPSKNISLEHSAVKAGQQAAAQAQDRSFAGQFGAQMPKTMGVDPVAQMKLTLYQQQQQSYNKLVQALIPRMYSAQSAMDRVYAVGALAASRQMNQHIFEAQKLGLEFSDNLQRDAINNKYKLGQISEGMRLAAQRTIEVFQAEKLDPTSLFKEKTDFAKFAATTEKSLGEQQQKALQDIAIARANLAKPGINSEQRKAEQENLNDAMEALKRITEQTKSFQGFKQEWYNLMGNMESISAGQTGVQGGASNAGPSASGFTVPPGGGVTDPQSYLHSVQPDSEGTLGGTSETDEDTDR